MIMLWYEAKLSKEKNGAFYLYERGVYVRRTALYTNT